MADKYDALKLEGQLCFPLYACSKEVVKRYKPFLDEIDLTYTQYIAMMVLWEQKKLSVKELGEYLFLDSGTLTPLLKTLEKKGFINRYRSSSDERVLFAEITEAGMELRERAVEVPYKMSECISLNKDDALTLYNLLQKMIGQLKEEV